MTTSPPAAPSEEEPFLSPEAVAAAAAAFPPSLAPELDSAAGRRKSASCGILEAINSLTLGMLACSR